MSSGPLEASILSVMHQPYQVVNCTPPFQRNALEHDQDSQEDVVKRSEALMWAGAPPHADAVVGTAATPHWAASKGTRKSADEDGLVQTCWNGYHNVRLETRH